MKGASLGYALALPANNRLGWKGLPSTNALADYEKVYFTGVKSFMTLVIGHSQHLSRNTRSQCYQTFLLSKVLIFVLS